MCSLLQPLALFDSAAFPSRLWCLESFAVSSRLSCECSTIPRKPTAAKSKDVCVLLGSFVKSKDVALSFGLSS
jgi:hypothetical protein